MKLRSFTVFSFALTTFAATRNLDISNTTNAFPASGTCSFHMVVHETCEKTDNKKVPWVEKRYGNIAALVDGAGVRYDPGPGHENFLLSAERHYFHYGNVDWNKYLGVYEDRSKSVFFVVAGPCWWLHTVGNKCGRCYVGDWTAGEFQCWKEEKVMHRYFGMDCFFPC